MTTEVETATPAEQVAAEQVQEVESNSTEATAEQTQDEQQTQEQKDEGQKKEPWFQKRINEQTRKYYEEARKRQELEQRLYQYEQRQQYQVPAEQQEQGQHVDVDALAEQKAAQLLAQRSFDEACNKVFAEGTKEFPENFEKAVANLQLVGPTREFLEAVTAADAGHKVLNHLGQLDNLAEAERIMRLPPVQMGRELAKLELKLNQPPPPKPVSKAPAPITPIGTTSSSGEPDVSRDPEAWIAWRNQQLNR